MTLRKDALSPAPLRLLEDPRCRGAAMVAVGDVKAGHPPELGFDESDLRRVGDDPGAVAHAVGRSEVHARGLGRLLCDQCVEGRVGPVHEEHGAGLSVQRLDVPHAVVLLIGPRQLVLLDDAFEVVLATRGGDQPGLAVPAHDLAVQIEMRLRVLPQRALRNQPPEILPSLGIDLRRVNIRRRRQINLRLADMEEAQGIAGRDLPRLFGRHDIVRQLTNAGRQRRLGAQCCKRLNDGHE